MIQLIGGHPYIEAECLWELECVYEEILDQSRWTTDTLQVYNLDGEMYGVVWTKGSTEDAEMCWPEDYFQHTICIDGDLTYVRLSRAKEVTRPVWVLEDKKEEKKERRTGRARGKESECVNGRSPFNSLSAWR